MDEPGQCLHVRVKVDKPIKLRNDTGEFDGQLVEISYSGAAVNLETLDFDDGAHLELDSEYFSHLFGEIVPTVDDVVALSFDMNDEAKYQLMEKYPDPFGQKI